MLFDEQLQPCQGKAQSPRAKMSADISKKKSRSLEEGLRGISREPPAKIWILQILPLLDFISWGTEVVGLVQALDMLSMC